MNSYQLANTKHVLCLGAHADDIEIGCGGSILKMIDDNPQLEITWVVLSGRGKRRDEAEQSARLFLGEATNRRVMICEFEDSYFPTQWRDIKESIHSIAGDIQPDVVFSHRKEDAHQDHRVVAELTWNAFRNQVIYEYEIPKYDADLTPPNVYSQLSTDVVTRKVDYLCRSFESQQSKPWYDDETFRALLRLRGLECHSPSRYAEAFVCRKLVF